MTAQEKVTILNFLTSIYSSVTSSNDNYVISNISINDYELWMKNDRSVVLTCKRGNNDDNSYIIRIYDGSSNLINKYEVPNKSLIASYQGLPFTVIDDFEGIRTKFDSIFNYIFNEISLVSQEILNSKIEELGGNV